MVNMVNYTFEELMETMLLWQSIAMKRGKALKEAIDKIDELDDYIDELEMHINILESEIEV
jgi:hypothetical protein